MRPIRLAYQPPANNTFLSEQTSQQQPANSTFLSEQISTSRQQNEQADDWRFQRKGFSFFNQDPRLRFFPTTALLLWRMLGA
jgi:hypothetical protein